MHFLPPNQQRQSTEGKPQGITTLLLNIAKSRHYIMLYALQYSWIMATLELFAMYGQFAHKQSPSVQNSANKNQLCGKKKI